MAATNPILTSSFGSDFFPPAVADQLIAGITSGNPFASSLRRWDTATTRAVFGVIRGFSGAAWIAEGSAKPDVLTDATSYAVTACELAGIPMISERALRDSRVDLLAEVQRVLRLYFGKTLDDGLLHGDGTPPNPQGVLEIAPAASGATLWESVHDAKAGIVSNGGVPSTLALPPAAVVAEEARLDTTDKPLYPDGITSYAGLTVVAVPALAATEGLVYDAQNAYLVVAEDFKITPSSDYAEAYKRDSIALRTSGQFAVGVPVPDMSIRKLTVT